MINLYIIHVKFWQNYFIGKDRSSPMIIVKIKNVAIATFFFWYSKWDYTTRVGKIIHRIIFAFVSAGPRPARNLATSFSSPMIIVKIKNVAFATFLFWCPKWDSNPHGFPHDFESCASASSAIRAFLFTSCVIFFLILNILNILTQI